MKTSFPLIAGILGLASQVSGRVCFAPEPPHRICYSEPGGTPQNISLPEITYIAGYLRFYGRQPGNPQFYTMPLPVCVPSLSFTKQLPICAASDCDYFIQEADMCAEWQATTKGTTWLMAKLVGDDAASVTFDDIADTIDGGANATPAQRAAALYGCNTAGGQIGVKVNTADVRYQQPQFTNGTFTNKGIVLKLVRNPGS